MAGLLKARALLSLFGEIIVTFSMAFQGVPIRCTLACLVLKRKAQNARAPVTL